MLSRVQIFAAKFSFVQHANRNRYSRGLSAFVLVCVCLLRNAAALADEPLATIEAPRADVVEALGLRQFYKQHLDAKGFAIIASDQVDKAALREAAYLVDRMLEGKDDVRRALTANKVRLVVMSPREFTTQIPEQIGRAHV